jgi:hypothetical protein
MGLEELQSVQDDLLKKLSQNSQQMALVTSTQEEAIIARDPEERVRK